MNYAEYVNGFNRWLDASEEILHREITCGVCKDTQVIAYKGDLTQFVETCVALGWADEFITIRCPTCSENYNNENSEDFA